MNDQNEKELYLKRVYNLAVLRGLCGNRGEFAKVLGVSRNSLSSAMNGDVRALTDSLIRKVSDFAKIHQLEEAQQPEPEVKPIIIPAETYALYEKMADSIKNLSELLNKMQPGTPPPSGLSPKNFRVDK